MKTDWKLLFIGNSFSDDTMEHVADILKALGVQTVTLGNLYIGGCSVNKHTEHITHDMAVYEYRTNTGSGWSTVPGVSIRSAVQSDVWDAVAIQNGTADGSRNTDEQSYDKLPTLVAHLRALIGRPTPIVFNMTWVGDPWHSHPETVSFAGDQPRMYREVARLAREIVSKQVDIVSPAGTAVQNAREAGLSGLTRDGYHLSWGLGRFMAGLTFVGAVTGLPIENVLWAPEGVSDIQRQAAIKAAQDALRCPFEITPFNNIDERYVSDTTAGSANQTVLESDGRWHTARVYYTLSAGGESYSLLFGDTLESTFADGSRSRCNDMGGDWTLADVRVGLCDTSSMRQAVEPSAWTAVTFDGQSFKAVQAGTLFESDPIALSATAGAVLCVELRYRGERMPCHEELWVASFVKDGDGFAPSKALPVPLRVGVKREAVRLAFLGDSITQGVGSTENSYRHWVARVAQAIGPRYAVWNLGIGFARSGDAASDGAWLLRAKQNDKVVLCLGVNDLLRGISAEDVCENLRRIVMILRGRGIAVTVQTVPPFEGLPASAREEVNTYIHNTLVCDGVFDTSFMADENGAPRFGGHPNDDGCALWAQKLAAYIKETWA